MQVTCTAKSHCNYGDDFIKKHVNFKKYEFDILNRQLPSYDYILGMLKEALAHVFMHIEYISDHKKIISLRSW